jgi:hypothetical protein
MYCSAPAQFERRRILQTFQMTLLSDCCVAMRLAALPD